MRLHPGTVCRLDAPGRPFHLEHCTVRSFDAAKNKWQIQLEGSQWNGKELLVPESALRLAFCLLPDSVAKRKKMVALIEEDAQGSCGRGLIVAQSVAPGSPLFEEPPLILSSSGKGMHQDRWRAYLTLMMAAQQQPAHRAALAAFDDLGISDLPTMLEVTKVASSAILSEALAAAGQDLPPDERARQQEKVTNALMKFQSNQFKYANVEPETTADNGVSDDAASRFSAAAVFAFTSRLNHSCSPSAFVSTSKAKFSPGTLVDSDGVLHVRAIRALLPGERLTLNYGPAELVTSWPLERRRQYLQDKCGFVCGCERCVKEEAEQLAQVAKAALVAQAAAQAEKVAAEFLADEEEAAAAAALKKGGGGGGGGGGCGGGGGGGAAGAAGAAAKKKKRNKSKKGKKGGGAAGGDGGGAGMAGGAEDGGEEEDEGDGGAGVTPSATNAAPAGGGEEVPAPAAAPKASAPANGAACPSAVPAATPVGEPHRRPHSSPPPVAAAQPAAPTGSQPAPPAAAASPQKKKQPSVKAPTIAAPTTAAPSAVAAQSSLPALMPTAEWWEEPWVKMAAAAALAAAALVVLARASRRP